MKMTPTERNSRSLVVEHKSNNNNTNNNSVAASQVGVYDDGDESSEAIVQQQSAEEEVHAVMMAPMQFPFYNYIDYSTELDKAPHTPLTAVGRVPTFPAKLHAILHRPEFAHVVKWLPHGRAWRVRDAAAFEHRVIPLYFEFTKHASSSFFRQAKLWGFRRLKREGPDKDSFYHPRFLRGLPHLCKDLKRPTKLPPDNDRDQEPDLSLISQMYPVPRTDAASSDPTITLPWFLNTTTHHTNRNATNNATNTGRRISSIPPYEGGGGGVSVPQNSSFCPVIPSRFAPCSSSSISRSSGKSNEKSEKASWKRRKLSALQHVNIDIHNHDTTSINDTTNTDTIFDSSNTTNDDNDELPPAGQHEIFQTENGNQEILATDVAHHELIVAAKVLPTIARRYDHHQLHHNENETSYVGVGFYWNEPQEAIAPSTVAGMPSTTTQYLHPYDPQYPCPYPPQQQLLQEQEQPCELFATATATALLPEDHHPDIENHQYYHPDSTIYSYPDDGYEDDEVLHVDQGLDLDSFFTSDFNLYPFYDYEDYSQQEDRHPWAAVTEPGTEPTFPSILHAILIRRDLNHVIAWMPHGRSWKVLDEPEFEKRVIPLYFKFPEQHSYWHFMQQVKLWGFRRLQELQGSSNDDDHHQRDSFYHCRFLRGLPHLCRDWKTAIDDSNDAIEVVSEPDEPDFDRISEIFPVPEYHLANDTDASFVNWYLLGA